MIKGMLNDWDKKYPGRSDNIFAALTRVSPSQLADRDLYDFESLELDRSTPAPAVDARAIEQYVDSWIPADAREEKVEPAPPMYIEARNL